MSVAERVHLLLSAGRGPRECGWAVAQLLVRLEADAGRHGLITHRVETVAGDRPETFRSALVGVLALDRLRTRLQEQDRSAGRTAVTDRWRVHDDLVRGDPTRIERPS